MAALKMSKERIKEIDSYLKREHKAGTLNVNTAKSDLQTSADTISKRLAALNLKVLGQNQVLLSTVNALNEWIKENTFTVQGKKYFDNEQFIKEVMRLEDMTETEAIKRASYIVRNVPELNIKNITPLKKGRGNRVKQLGEAFDNNKTFKDNYIKKHGKKKIADLTNDQLNTALGTLAKIKKDADLIPKDAITLQEFSKQSGISESNIKALRGTLKNSARGKEFNRIFPFTVIPNQKTFISKTGLKDKIKEYKDFMDKDFASEETIERVNKFKNSKVIQKFLDDRDSDLWTKKGRTKAINVLGGATPYQASYAMSTLARAYDGDKIRGIDVKPDKDKARFIFKSLTNLKERDPWSAPVYEQGLRQVDKELKGVGSFKSFKTKYTEEMNEIFDKMKIPKKYRTSINEIIPVKGAYRNNIAPFSAFVDLTRSDLNRYIAGQQSDLSKAISYLDKYKNDTAKFQRKIRLFNEQTNVKRLAGIEKKFGKEAADQVRLASLVEGTDVESVYDKADLDRYAKKGLDIRKFAKDKGYFIDVKGARPFFEVTKDDLRKAVSTLGKGEQLRFCNALNEGGLAVPGCAKAIEKNPVKAATILSEAEAPTPKMQMVKTFATNFLKSPGVKTFGAGAAIGTAIGLVKAFRNDDPTTYLSNEDQQKNMLVDMATQPVSLDIERPAILDYQLPALGVSVVGSTALAAPSTIKASKSRALGIERKPPGIAKTGLRVLGRGLGVAASPLLLAPLAAGDIASQIAEGDSPTDIATDPLNYLYPAFADQTPKLTRGLPSAFRKAARLGLPKIALKGLSRLGIGGFAASAAIQGLGLLDD